MFARSVRGSRQCVASTVRRCAATPRRTFLAPTAIRQADLVQELYLRELRNTKLLPTKPSDAEAHVQKWTPPKPPRLPEEGDIAKDLKAYEEQQPEVEVQAPEGGSAAAEHDWFEEEEDEPTTSSAH